MGHQDETKTKHGKINLETIIIFLCCRHVRQQRKMVQMQRMKSFSCPQLLISNAAESSDPAAKTTLSKFGLLNRTLLPSSVKMTAASGGSSAPLKRRRLGVTHLPDPNFFVIGETLLERDLGQITERSPMLDESSGASNGTTTTQITIGLEDDADSSTSSRGAQV